MAEIVFGNKSEFGIRYVPGWKSKDSKYYFAKLHLLLDGQIIGDKDETCLVGTWMHSMQDILNILEQDYSKLYHEEFENRTDVEVFEMIKKSNQLVEDYSLEYYYLPVLSNEIWGNCNVNIDETIDGYFLTMINKEKHLKFIWKGWRKPCPIDRINKLYSKCSNRKHVIQIIQECLDFVERDLANYEIKPTS